MAFAVSSLHGLTSDPPVKFLGAQAPSMTSAAKGGTAEEGENVASAQRPGQVQTQTVSVSLGNANVCQSGKTSPAPCNQAATLTYSVTASITLGTPLALTMGTPNLDFILAPGGTCIGTVTSGSTCTVNVTFAPLYAGVRQGAIEIVDSSGNLITTTYINGVGGGPQIAYGSNAETTIINGLADPEGVAVDGAGDVFAVDTFLDSVVKLPAGGGTPVNVGSGLSYPIGIALDGAGNLFVADTNGVQEFLAVGGYTTKIALPSSFYLVGGLTVDGSGNLYVDDWLRNTVYQLSASGGYATLKPLGSGFNEPAGLAVDASGNVFVADSGNNAVKEILAAGGYTTVNTLGSGFYQPEGVALDPSGNVYVADAGNGAVKEILSLADYATVNTLVTGLNQTNALTLDGAGNVFVSDFDANSIVELPRSLPPQLSFALTPLGATSSDSPQSVLVGNIGNASLSFSGLSASANFALAPGSGTPADCSSTTSLVSGDSCNLSVSFMPVVGGPLTGYITLTDNALNGANAEQQLSLSGTGELPQAQVSSSLLQFGTVAYSTSESLTLTVSNVGAGTLTIAPSISNANFSIANSTCGAGVTAGNSCVLKVLFNPTSIGTYSGTLTLQANGTTNPVVQLQGLASGLVATTATVQFGNVPLGTPKIVNLTVTNSGIPGKIYPGHSVTGTAYVVRGNSANTCQHGITSGQSCVLPVQFTPVSVGEDNQTLTVTATGQLALTVPLQGAGADLVPAKSTLQFGIIAFGAAEILPLTVTNSGLTGTVTISAASSGPSYTVLTTSQNTCKTGIASGKSCVLPVQFSAASTGVHNGTLTLTPSGGATPVVVQLLGTADTLTASSTTLQFGTIAVGSSKVLPLTVTNPGIPGTVTVGTSFNGPGYVILTTAQNTCKAGIAPGKSCVLPVQFTASSGGSHNHNLTITANGVAPIIVALQGSGK